MKLDSVVGDVMSYVVKVYIMIDWLVFYLISIPLLRHIIEKWIIKSIRTEKIMI